MAFDMTTLVSRRRVLQIGSLGLAQVALPKLLWADDRRRASGQEAKADACVLVYLNGGPSQLDMWDMKPEAPDEIRGSFKPIASSQPGVLFSEHLPRLARHMHESALIRSVQHKIGHAHGAAVYTTLTGHDRGDTINVTPTGPNDYPAIGSVAQLVRPPKGLTVPFVSLPYITTEGIGGPPQAGFFGGLLGRALDPLCVVKDPNAPDFSVPELNAPPDVATDRLARREALRDAVDARYKDGLSREMASLDSYRERAYSLIHSEATQRAFQLSREPDQLRDKYGRNIHGQSLLLTRRLLEAGTRVVTIAWSPDANATWDTHWDADHRLKDELLPALDMGVGSLLDDLVERGMLERTLVVIMGEFGRAPKISLVPGYPLPGRTHWPFCYSVWMAGGGIKPGFVLGASDKTGAFPTDSPVTPAQIIATIYHALGIPHTWEFRDVLNRPHAIVPWAEPLYEMFA